VPLKLKTSQAENWSKVNKVQTAGLNAVTVNRQNCAVWTSQAVPSKPIVYLSSRYTVAAKGTEQEMEYDPYHS
jgi:hypothetical protein